MSAGSRIHRRLLLEELEGRCAPGLMITGVSPSGGAGTPFDAIEVYFNVAVQDGTFDASDVALGGGPGAVSTVAKITATHYQIVCAGTGLATYSLTIGPNILDNATGDAMDQNRNGTPGEAGDAYSGALFSNGATISDGAYDGKSVVIYGNTVTLSGDRSFDLFEVYGGAAVNANGDTLDLHGLNVDGGAGACTFAVAGGATLNVADTIIVTGGSTLLCKSKDNTGQVGGIWVGAGVTINAANVTVSAGSAISADGQGYVAPVTNGAGIGPGGGPGNAGATHGGIGGVGNWWGSANTTLYGDPMAPTALGSSGGGYDALGGGSGGAGGGAITMYISGTLALAGEITADGESVNTGRGDGGGAGGSLYITANTLTGGGRFSADGGSSLSSRGGGGGGGRIAVYYAVDGGFGGFLASTAAGGTGVNSGAEGTVGFFDTSVANNHLHVYHKFVFAQDSSVTLGALTLDNGSTVTVGGGSTITIDGDLTVTGSSTLLLQGKNNTAQVGGKWVGEGVTIQAANVTVGAGSLISADGQGYVGSTFNTSGIGPGGGPGNAGGTYAGLGGSGEFWPSEINTNIYGNSKNPLDLGSSGGGYDVLSGGSGGSGGGAIRLIVSGTVTLDGEITADGQSMNTGRGDGGGAGGSVYLTANTLTGSGVLSADGGSSLSNRGGGGSGGRILLNVGTLGGTMAISADGGDGAGGGGGGAIEAYYWDTMTLPGGNITANGGIGPIYGDGAAGSALVSDTPYVEWIRPDDAMLHGTETLEWLALGVNPFTCTSEIWVYGAAQKQIASGLPVQGTTNWDTTSVRDGRYDIRVRVRDGGSAPLAEASIDKAVNNAATWHSGTISANETWTTGSIHIVEADVAISGGVTVTINPGVVVKFVKDTKITVEDGAVLNGPATSASPIIMTSLSDDTAGGDTNFDGAATLPLPGDWKGFDVAGTGQLNMSQYVDLRYMDSTHSGVIAASITWLGTFLHHITGDVIVPNGVTLTIAAGAVVKTDPHFGIVVQAGGRLVVSGTVALPVVFTSIRDDSFGGDTNNDGNATTPSAGDWRWIYVDGGTATLRYAQLLYGGGTDSGLWENTGVIRTDNNAQLSISNSLIKDAFFDGVACWNATATVSNSILVGVDRAICAFTGGTVHVINCTVDDNQIGLFVHGGTMDATNTIVSNSIGNGVQYDFGTLTSVRYCNVWGSGGANYSGTPDPTGTNGNRSVDPRYVDRARGDYRLQYVSPMIDAADGLVAPFRDFLGAVRYDDPRTPNTGIVANTGVFADIGAFEFVETASSEKDLIVTEVSGPTQAIAGNMVTVQWTVRNMGPTSIIGPWHDSIALVLGSGTGATVIQVGEVVVGTGVVLGPGQTLTASASLRVPGGAIGYYHWQVTTNSRGEIFEGGHRDNNTTASTALAALDVPEIVVGGPALNRQFTQAGEEQWFKFVAAAGQDILVSLNLSGDVGATELYIGRGYMPTRSGSDVHSQEWNSDDVTALVSNTTSQTYYVLAYARTLPGATPFTIGAEAQVFSLTSIDQAQAGDSGTVTIGLRGGQLEEAMSYEIVDPGGTPYAAASVFFVNSSEVYATFNMAGLPHGLYDVQVRKGPATRVLTDVLNVVTAVERPVEVHVSVPNALRPGWTAQVTIDYANTGNVDILAPLMHLAVSNAYLRFVGDSAWSSTMVQILATSHDGPAGTLAPGDRETITLEVKAILAGDIDYKLTTSSDPTATLDWGAVKAKLKPDDVPNAAWDAIYTNLLTQVGNTVGQYQAVLADNATYLSKLGQYTCRVDRLLAFELDQAGAFGEIAQRYRCGAFGYGHADVTDMGARTDANGVVTICVEGAKRVFSPRGDGTYLSSTGDFGQLSVQRGEYRLLEQDGSLIVFGSDGKLRYCEDSNGNRLTATYVGARLAGYRDSIGATVTYTYNAKGRIAQAAYRSGVVVTYTYDAAGEHLLSASSSQGEVVSYTYVTGQGAAREHALASVTADGATMVLQYDTLGRPVKRLLVGSAEEVILSYDSAGGMTLTDAGGGSTVLCYDDMRRLVLWTNPMGLISRLEYDENGTIARITASDGSAYSYTHDSLGLLQRMVDPMGYSFGFESDSSLRRTTGVTNPLGVSRQWQYDNYGNLTALVQPDGTADRYAYDALGRIVESTTRAGQTTTYTYDANGFLLQKSISGGGITTFSYDAHGNLLSATDGHGTTTFTYNALDRLIRVVYPTGRSLEFTYDTAGRRVQMRDQGGFVVNYLYDAAGHLSQMTDGAGQPIVTYAYDSTGRISRMDMGNGMYTTYAYNGKSQVTQVINYAADHSVVSRFDYTYNAQGLRTGMTTLDGDWTYRYDADGQLVRVVTPSGRAIQYAYDAAGNRVSVDDDGAITNYARNTMDQYTSVGSATLSYDPNGNLTFKSEGGNTWIYAYDAENRLIHAITPDGTWDYEYDALGSRVATVHDGQRTEHLIDPVGLGNLVADYDGTGGLIAHYVHGWGLAASFNAINDPFYYQFDGSGNTVAIAAGNGAVVNSYGYLPFGEITGKVELIQNPFEFGGKYGLLEAGNGQTLMRARQYDPSLGRFISADYLHFPIGNAYAYAENSPTNYTDLTGLSAQQFMDESSFQFDVAGSMLLVFQHTMRTISNTIVASGTMSYTIYLAPGNVPVTLTKPSVEPYFMRDLIKRGAAYRKLAMTFGKIGNSLGIVGGVLNAITAGQEWYNYYGSCNDWVAGRITTNDLIKAGSRAVGKSVFAFVPFGQLAIDLLDDWSDKAAQSVLNPIGSTNQANFQIFGPAMGPRGVREQWLRTRVVQDIDPNDIVGPEGYGAGHFVADGQVLPYTIRFENQDTATAPAQVVTITQTLDPDLDWSTFRLSGFGFGGQVFAIPDGLNSYHTRIDATDRCGLYVDVVISLNEDTGVVTWQFLSIDPVTNAVTLDPLGGFLPPNHASPEGEGWVSYSIQPKDTLVTGDLITAQATIVFGANPPINTPAIFNTVDAAGPTSQINALAPTTASIVIPLSWTGSDDGGGAGIAGYDIYVSDNAAAYALWKSGVTGTSIDFIGQYGHTYAFYSVATDNVGHREAAPVGPDATTQVIGAPPEVWRSGDNQVILYDTDGTLDVTAADVAITLDRNGSVSGVTIVGNHGGLGIVVNPTGTGPVSFSDRRSAKTALPVSFIACMDPVAKVSLNSGMTGWYVGQTLVFEGLLADADLDGDGSVADRTAIYTAGPAASIQITGGVGGDVVAKGADTSGFGLSSFTVRNGDVTGEVVVSDGGLKTFRLTGNLKGALRVHGDAPTVQVTGGVDGATVDIGGNVNSLRVTGAVTGSSLHVGGNLGSARIAGAVTDTTLIVGGNLGQTALCGNVADASISVVGATAGLTIGGTATTIARCDFDLSGNVAKFRASGAVSGSTILVGGNAATMQFSKGVDATATQVAGTVGQASFLGGMTNGSSLTVGGKTATFKAQLGVVNSTVSLFGGAEQVSVSGGMAGAGLRIGRDPDDGWTKTLSVKGVVSAGSAISLTGNLASGTISDGLNGSRFTVEGDVTRMTFGGAIDGGSEVHVTGAAAQFSVTKGGVRGNSTVALDGSAKVSIAGDRGGWSVAGGSTVTIGAPVRTLTLKEALGGTVNITGSAAGTTLTLTGSLNGRLLAATFGNVTVTGSFRGEIGDANATAGTGNTLRIKVAGGGGVVTPVDAFAAYIGYP